MNSGNRKENDLGHGPRLSDREYERRIVGLYEGLPPSPGRKVEEEIHRRELDLAIDHRLGQDFPKERRDALWDIQKRVEKRRLRLVLHWFTHFISYGWLHRRADKVAGYLVDEYAKVLTKDELRAFFDLGENEKPTLPIDRL